MKKSILFTLMVLLLALAPMAALADTMYVTTESGSGVHMRSTPDTSDDSNIITTVPYGAAVTVNTIMADVPFANVTYDGQTGYMELDYLSKTQPPAKPSGSGSSSSGTASSSGDSALEQELAALYTGFVATNYEAVVVPASDYVNLRWAPSLSAPVRSEYHEGAVLQVLSANDTWSEVYDEEARVSGYMETQFLQQNEEQTWTNEQG